MAIYPYSFTLPPVNKQDIPSNGVPGEFLGISAGGVLDWLPVSGGSGTGDLLAANNLSELTPTAGTARTNLGLGTSDSPTFANLTLTSPSLASSAPVTISQTWNNAAVAFTGLKVNAVSTASASGSLLADFQLGGVSQLNVTRSGGIRFATTNSILLTGSGGSITIGGPSGNVYLGDSSSFGSSFIAGVAGFFIKNSLPFGWSSDATSFGTPDTILLRDSPSGNTLALRNGALAQTFRVYNTYTDASNYERAIFSFNSNRLEISTGQAGAGVSRKIDFGTNGATGITFFTNTTNRWGIGSDGHFVAAADNTYDIGASGASRPRNVYVGTGIVSGSTIDAPYIRAGSAGGLQMQGRFFISSAADGNICLTNNAVTDFGRLQFGGTTNLFPSIKRNAAGLQIRLADDSANATLEAGNLYASGNVGIGTTSPTSKLHVVGDELITGNSSLNNGLFNTNTTRVAGLIPFQLGTSSYLGFTQTYNPADGAVDTILLRDGEGTDHLAMRRATNGQKFSVYGTYPGANWERFTITAPTSGNVLLGTYIGTGGVPRGMEFQTDGVMRMTIGAAGGITIPFSGGPLTVSADINGQRDIYCGTGRYFRYNNTSAFSSAGAGIVVFEDLSGSNTTPRFQLGGTTNLFPAIKRNAAGLDIVLANDSGFAAVQDLYRRFGTGSPEGVVTAPTGAVYHNTSGGSATTFYVKESSPTPNTGWVGK